jgi:hypothetical protein
VPTIWSWSSRIMTAIIVSPNCGEQKETAGTLAGG